MVGLTTKRSLKLWGIIKERRVIVLVDCGASHTFISTKLVQEMGLPVEETPTYYVEVGDRHKIQCKSVCKGLVLHVQGLEIQQEFFFFALQGANLVLGLDWLASLGDIEANFQQLVLKIHVGGTLKVLKGEPALSRPAASFKSLTKAFQDEGQGLLVEYKAIEDLPSNNDSIPRAVTQVLFPTLAAYAIW
ncbi:Aspartic peptidase domain superfamily [Sesbania bispinosa]|nr:Aspartic peptidase domain superfamily [Sesbania bispinosa]